jgi:hypothetical protein
MAKSPKRKKSDGLYNNSVYQQREGYASRELKILNNSSSKGYAVSIPNVAADSNKTWNAALLAPFGSYIKMWVTDFEMSFSVNGTVGQSRYRRQFFPKSFNQPTINVKGVMPNQKEYNRLASFIRECHFEALTGNQDLYNLKDQQSGRAARGSSQSIQTVTLLIKNAGPAGESKPLRNVKGRHRAMQLDGYIKNIAAGARKFEFAPEFTFEFIPASSKMTGSVGIYEDQMDEGSEIMSWMDLFDKNAFGNQIVKDNRTESQKPVK